MKLSQLLTAPNQLTLLRMMFVPFIVIDLVAGHYRGRSSCLSWPDSVTVWMDCWPGP